MAPDVYGWRPTRNRHAGHPGDSTLNEWRWHAQGSRVLWFRSTVRTVRCDVIGERKRKRLPRRRSYYRPVRRRGQTRGGQLLFDAFEQRRWRHRLHQVVRAHGAGLGLEHHVVKTTDDDHGDVQGARCNELEP